MTSNPVSLSLASTQPTVTDPSDSGVAVGPGGAAGRLGAAVIVTVTLADAVPPKPSPTL